MIISFNEDKTYQYIDILGRYYVKDNVLWTDFSGSGLYFSFLVQVYLYLLLVINMMMKYIVPMY